MFNINIKIYGIINVVQVTGLNEGELNVKILLQLAKLIHMLP